jgi:hypothetical protein
LLLPNFFLAVAVDICGGKPQGQQLGGENGKSVEKWIAIHHQFVAQMQ